MTTIWIIGAFILGLVIAGVVGLLVLAYALDGTRMK